MCLFYDMFLSNLPTKLHLSVYHKWDKYHHWKVKVKAFIAALDIIPWKMLHAKSWTIEPKELVRWLNWNGKPHIFTLLDEWCVWAYLFIYFPTSFNLCQLQIWSHITQHPIHQHGTGSKTQRRTLVMCERYRETQSVKKIYVRSLNCK